MRRLIIVTKKWGRNFTGATLATQYLTEKWMDHYDRISVYTLQSGEAIEDQAITVYKFKNEYQLIRKLIKDAKNIKTNSKFACYSDDHLGFVFSVAGLPYIHTYHGNWPEAKYISVGFYLKSFYFMPLYKWTIKKASCVVNVSTYMEKFTLKYNRKSRVIHNGFERKTLQDETVQEQSFLMVGNIDQRKYGYAIKVFKTLRQMDSDVKIDVFGKILDQKLAKKLETFSNVHLCGTVKNIPYRKYQGLISTSKIENLSISVCEAIQNKIPVFCFSVGGLPEVVLNDKTGYVFSNYDIEAMVTQIQTYIDTERKMIVDSSILDDFDWEIAANKYLKLFC